jgi:hypothetical protein
MIKDAGLDAGSELELRTGERVPAGLDSVLHLRRPSLPIARS